MAENHYQQFLTPPPLIAGVKSSSDEAFLNSTRDGISLRSLLNNGSFEPSTEDLNLLQMPKTEPLIAVEDNLLSDECTPYNFFSDSTPPSLPHRLPSLLSYEQPQNSAAVISPNANPRVEKTTSYRKRRSSKRQQRPSDKTRYLQKLLPWDGKANMATVLEEAYKYIKFLQAQVSVLQSMPCESNSRAAADAATMNNGGGGMLGKLNRQQLLQVAANTPAVQTQLYSKGCCLYSMEQMMLLKKKALYHQMMTDSSVNPNSFFSRN
ncbi:hypothetical protein CASFOL_040908 [Castilleja foliolosa]|uniref:BHLH domain-containing protein n=1 Tax=Castilleja foliolosa TaxID=1961234 RepID=A0ABD3BD80_9LAMI